MHLREQDLRHEYVVASGPCPRVANQRSFGCRERGFADSAHARVQRRRRHGAQVRQDVLPRRPGLVVEGHVLFDGFEEQSGYFLHLINTLQGFD